MKRSPAPTVALAAVLLAGCGARATATSPPGDPPAAGGSSPRAVAMRAVEHVLATAPLPPGIRPATAKEAQGKRPQSTPLDDNLVQLHRTYVVALGLGPAIEWFSAHRPPDLQSPGGTSSASGPDGVTSQGVEFDGRATRLYDGLEEQVGVFPLDDSHSVVRVDAMATWLPQRTAAERAPEDATAVVGTRVSGIGARPQRFRLTGRPVRELARALDGLRPTNAYGMINCPNDDGAADRLRFLGRTSDPVFHVAASGCAFIGVTVDGKPQPGLSGGYLVDKLLNRLLAGR
ncbi:MAG TPA: hypothetical protein VHW64_02615 [Nocardioides sp.]|jgi:hypothetical protein|uniref:hypothetical protein n=1 Tax=Nocardioides sp. TaxID=35761 RepID=UPI002E36DF6C|nr:hypothetical protein [Nocardioides sp.]HEX3929570.1 hypothetical protein [Nocardioides sp.]